MSEQLRSITLEHHPARFDLLWATGSAIRPEDDGAQAAPSLLPDPGGTRFVLTHFPPLAAFAGYDLATARREFLDRVPDLAAEMDQSDPGMHKTDTLDYDIVLSGEVWIEAEDGSTHCLRAGDVAVVCGTRRRWRNRSPDVPCVMASVLIAQPRGSAAGAQTRSV